MLSLLVQRKSLLILQDDMYKCYLHGIQGVSEDILSEHVVNLSSTGAQVGDALPRSTRVSLTIRHVPKVVRANLLLGKKWHIQTWLNFELDKQVIHFYTPKAKCVNVMHKSGYNILLYMSIRISHCRYLTGWCLCSSLWNICPLKAESCLMLYKSIYIDHFQWKVKQMAILQLNKWVLWYLLTVVVLLFLSNPLPFWHAN